MYLDINDGDMKRYCIVRMTCQRLDQLSLNAQRKHCTKCRRVFFFTGKVGKTFPNIVCAKNKYNAKI